MTRIADRDYIEETHRIWQANWPKAKSIWSPFVKLREPQFCLTSKEAISEGLAESFAMIRLTDHRIVIDLEKVCVEGIEAFSLEILSHEIGHHIYTPANLYDNALLQARIGWGLADLENRAPFVANLYEDLLINDFLQRTKKLNISGVYSIINKVPSSSKIWLFYMRTFEYLWKMQRGALATSSELLSPTIDADASLAASLIRSYSKKWMDGGGRFAALLYPYLIEDEEYQKARKSLMLHLDSENAGEGGGMITGLAEINEDDIAGVVDPRTEAASSKEGGEAPAIGINKSTQGGEGPRQRYLRPGAYIDLFKRINPKANEQEIINNYYKEIALPHLVSFPLETLNPTSLSLPEGTESWDVSDPIEEIDWIETAIGAPEIFPGYNTVKRIYGHQEDDCEKLRPLDVYIGVDCSGSMGNPKVQFSWPILAATVIGLSALRAGAKVMACLSGEPGSFMETDGYRCSEKEVLTVLTSYLGTGYSFGVPRLERPFGIPSKSKSHIVLVTDDDIFSMLDAVKEKGKVSNWEIIKTALKNSGGIGTIVLHSRGEWHQQEVKKLKEMGWNIYYVTNEQQLVDFAREFSNSNYHFKKNGNP